MPRRRRNQTPVPAPVEVPLAQVPPSRHAVRVRATCPVCGMMPEVERLQSSPYPAEVRIQRFGGSFPATDGQPMRGFMEYGFGNPQQLLDAIGLFLLLIDETWQALLELLPSAYQDAGLDEPPPVVAHDLPRILESLPSKDELLHRLLAEDTLHRRRNAG